MHRTCCREGSFVQRSPDEPYAAELVVDGGLRSGEQNRSDRLAFHTQLSERMCLCATPPDLMEKDSEGREEQPSAPGLKVTDCFPSETFETLSFLSRPATVLVKGGEGGRG